MDSTLAPDPYLALGVPRDADAATIKSAYRRLILTCHPDKVTDASLKQQKQEEFQRIHAAFEILKDEKKRADWDAEARLELLRGDRQSRSGPTANANANVTPARYGVRTQTPAGAASSTNTNGPSRYDDHKPTSRPYEDDRHYEERASSSRKYATYDAVPRQTSRSVKEPIRGTTKLSSERTKSDRTRSDRTKTRDKEERRERSSKHTYADDEPSSNDEKARYEAEYRRREDERQKRDEEDALKKFNEVRRSQEERREPRRHRSGDDHEPDRQRNLSDKTRDAIRHMQRTNVDADRPSPNRTVSSRDVRPDAYERSFPRRTDPRRSRDSPRDRKGSIPEIVDWDDRKPPPSFNHSSSSPADIHHLSPRGPSQRSQTEYRRSDASPPPTFRRSETTPVSSSSRRNEATLPSRPSGLRTSESAASREPVGMGVFPTVQPVRVPVTKKYYYPIPEASAPLYPPDVAVANGHRTVLKEPARRSQRSPSPLSKPPIGPHRSVPLSSAIPPPPLGRSANLPLRTEERGRSHKLFYGEVDPRTRENARRQTSFSPDNVSYTRKIGPEDISWSADRREIEDRGFTKPSFGRHATFAY